MKKKSSALLMENDLHVDLTLHNVSAGLLTEFVQKIVQPYYAGNLNASIQDLIQKVLCEEDFILSHVTHLRATQKRQLGLTTSYERELNKHMSQRKKKVDF